MLNSSKLLDFLRACTCGQPCRTYASMVLGGVGDVTVAPPADARLVRLNAAKLALYESIFLWEYLADEDDEYEDIAKAVRIANMCGASLSDIFPPQRSISDGQCWGSDCGDSWWDLFSNSGLTSSAYRMLCEANVAGASLPAGVIAFMARHNMVHVAECAGEVFDDCFSDDDDLSVDAECELAALLRDWDIRHAFGGGGGGGTA